MYLNFYQMQEFPFGLTPDPKFVFKTESYLEALSTVKYGVEGRKGLVVLIGEVGTGKTTTLRATLQQFNQYVLPVYLFNPYVNVSEFYEQLCRGLRLNLEPGASKAAQLEMLGRLLMSRHQHQMQTALIVDEAHGLAPAVLEEIRVLANFETNTEKLLQVILCGQPELSDVLNRQELRQLKQRISLRCVLKPLNETEINEYIRFRLKMAGAQRVNLFQAEAVALIARQSGGIPRVINNLCDNALLYGFAGGHRNIHADIVREAIIALDLTPADEPLHFQAEAATRFNGMTTGYVV